MIPAIETVIEMILADESAIRNIPPIMQERAQYARDALRNPSGHRIEFGRYGAEAYTFATWCKEDNRWYDITGHYHAKGPQQTIFEREEKHRRREDYSMRVGRIREKAWAEVGIQLDDGADSMAEHYYNCRRSFPRICQHCQEVETNKKFHWHHLDPTLKRRADKANSNLDDINLVAQPVEYKEAYKQFLIATFHYYNVPIGETILLCPKCHRNEHIRLKEGQ